MSLVGKKLIINGADFNDIKINGTIYAVSTNVTNGAYSGPSTIIDGDSITITILPNEGYKAPDSITVTNASYIYNKLTRTIIISNPTAAVTVSVACVVSLVPAGYTEVAAVGANNTTAYIKFNDITYNTSNKYETQVDIEMTTTGWSCQGIGWNYGGCISYDFDSGNKDIRDGSQVVSSMSTLGLTDDYRIRLKSIINTGSGGTTVSTAYNLDDLTKYRTVSRAHSSLSSHGNIPYTVGIYTDSVAGELNPLVAMQYKIYGVQMKVNDTLVKNLVPCVRDSDDTAGFWDRIGQTFITGTTANFSAFSE